jgi:hypothetical protein
MKTNNDFFGLGKEKLDQLKAVFEELELQLTLGKAEAKDAFEREKKNFSTFMQEQKLRFNKENQASEESWETMKEKFAHLESMLMKDTPDSKDSYDTQKNETLRCIYELENLIRDTYGELNSSLKSQFDQFKARLDAYRIQLALSEFDTKADGDKRREELKASLDEILDKMRSESERAHKLDDFAEEMGTAFDHVKRAFSDLFSK